MFDTILSNIVKSQDTKTKQGRMFENLIKQILLQAPLFKDTYDFTEVYLWSEFSDVFGLHKGDDGIDIMAKTDDNLWVAVQCKAIDPATTLNFHTHKIDKFISHHYADINADFPISQKLIFHTAKDTSKDFGAQINKARTPQCDIKIYGYNDLCEKLGIDWSAFDIQRMQDSVANLKLIAKKALRPHQKQALDSIKAHFLESNNPRAKVIMPCGTGKSLLAIHAIDSILQDSDIALFLAPSLALTNQMIEEFTKEAKHSYKIFAVCSDSKVGTKVKKDSEEDIESSELCIPPTTSPKALAEAINKHSGGGNYDTRIVIFSTYQSIDVIIQAQSGLSSQDKLFGGVYEGFKRPFTLVINDEAHRTAGFQRLDSQGKEKKEISVWNKTHDDSLLQATYRLYMTATPRIYGEKAKETTKEHELLLFSMDDEQIFGQEIYRLRFDEAITQGLLCDYRVLISFMSEEYLASFVNKKSQAQEKSHIALEDAGKMVGVYNALRKQNMFFITADGKSQEAFSDDKTPMKRAIAFHSSIKNSKFVTKNFCSIDSVLKYKDIIQHIDGNDNAAIKADRLHWLAKEDPDVPFKILSNAKCLTEGIDVPSLDAVAFFDPRDSVVDIVQAVGRAMRKAPDKKYGYIILPIVLSDEEIKNYDSTLKNTKFKGVWRVLKALRSHDERLVDEARINEVLSVVSESYELQMPETGLFSLSELVSEMKNAVPKNLGDLEYWESYAKKVGEIIHAIILRLESLLRDNASIQKLFENFCKALQANVNASFEQNEALHLIAQHITLKPIFDSLFPNIKFSEFDKVSQELSKLYDNLLDFGLDSQTKELEKFYESVRSNVAYAQSDKSRQDLIKNLYDTLFKSAFKKTQEKLGIVYTPLEVVDFIIHSVAYALTKHFGKNLSDSDVHICDPFAGTGTFITRLIQSGLLDSNLEYKYKNELWANEITLLAYYIAQINITSTYHERLSQITKSHQDGYTLLDNLLFTDTFNTYTPESRGFAIPQSKREAQDMTKMNYLAHNYAKIQEFKATPFKIIIANPPYSESQTSANDNNQNESYPYLEQRILDTYRAKSLATSTRNANYDSYKMAIRYASDRIESSGIIGLVTNASFIDGNSDDGLRACLEEEFSYIYIFNLRGNQRTSGETSRKEGGKIFDSGSRAPIAISIFIKKPQNDDKTNRKAEIYYYDIGDYHDRQTKLNIIQNLKSIESMESIFTRITPNKDYDWINQRDYSFMAYIPLGHRDTKLKSLPIQKPTPKIDPQVLESGYIDIFEIFSQGVITGKDSWSFNFSKQKLSENIQLSLQTYNAERELLYKNSSHELCSDLTKISWTGGLREKAQSNKEMFFKPQNIKVCLYRPFQKAYLYYDNGYNHSHYQMDKIYPFDNLNNIAISLTDRGSSKEFSALASRYIHERHFVANAQSFPLYYYERIESSQAQKGSGTQSTIDFTTEAKQNLDSPQSGGMDIEQNTAYFRRKDAIRDEALQRFQEVYNDSTITKEAMFYYIYALLNHPVYKEKYRDNLSKMIPRIPFVKDFWGLEAKGRELANLHLNYEGYAKECESLRVFACLAQDVKDLSLALTDPTLLTQGIDICSVAQAGLETLGDEDFTITKLTFGKDKKKAKDTSVIVFNEKIHIINIPKKAYEYIINGKSAIEWIMDRYQVSTDKASYITNDPNLYESSEGALKGLRGGRYVLELLLSVIAMSVKSVGIIESIATIDITQSQ